MASAIKDLNSQTLGRSGPALGVSLEKVCVLILWESDFRPQI